MVNNKQDSVLIMMATYNGEKYLREQLDSIINQDYINWNLIIQDDHSKDNTRDILFSYIKKDSRIKFRLSSQAGGVNRNFHSLINYCKENTDYDFYMFADQDDIWYKNKISQMVNFLKNHSDIDTPTLVYADMALIDQDGHCLDGTIGSKTKNEFKNERSYFFSHNVYGCNLIVNRKLFCLPPDVNLENKKELILSHDNYYAKSAVLFGKIFYINSVLMDYRRHGANVTVAQKYDFGIIRILQRLKNVDKLAEEHAYTYNQTLFLISKYRKQKMTVQQKILLDEVEKTIRKGGIQGIIYILKNRISWGNHVRTISHMGIMLLNLYKKYLFI